jgi:hypothetical protein
VCKIWRTFTTIHRQWSSHIGSTFTALVIAEAAVSIGQSELDPGRRLLLSPCWRAFRGCCAKRTVEIAPAEKQETFQIRLDNKYLMG